MACSRIPRSMQHAACILAGSHVPERMAAFDITQKAVAQPSEYTTNKAEKYNTDSPKA